MAVSSMYSSGPWEMSRRPPPYGWWARGAKQLDRRGAPHRRDAFSESVLDRYRGHSQPAQNGWRNRQDTQRGSGEVQAVCRAASTPLVSQADRRLLHGAPRATASACDRSSSPSAPAAGSWETRGACSDRRYDLFVADREGVSVEPDREVVALRAFDQRCRSGSPGAGLRGSPPRPDRAGEQSGAAGGGRLRARATALRRKAA